MTEKELQKLLFLLLVESLMQLCYVNGDSSCGIRSQNIDGQGNPLFIKTTASSDPIATWPWMASYGLLVIYENGTQGWDHQCGASIIGPDTVLTAAHCLGQLGRQWVRVGSTNLDTPIISDYTIQVKERFSHPEYRHPQAYFDVAVLKLQKSIRYNQYIKPLCLPTKASNYPDMHAANSVKLTGWGLPEKNSFESNSYLQRVDLRVFSQRVCNETHSRATGTAKIDSDSLVPKLFSNDLLCAGNELDGGSCKGDSGSPLMWLDTSTNPWRYVQVGLVSGGIGKCGDGRFPGVYVRVGHPNVLNFIHNFMNGTYLSEDDQLAVNLILFTASEEGNISQMKRALARGADLDYVFLGTPLLVDACKFGKVSSVELLLEEGANTESRDQDGLTALHWAAVKGRDKVVQLLIHYKANVNATIIGNPEHDGETALMIATDKGHTSIVRMLINAGAQVGTRDTYGAVSYAKSHIRKLLMKFTGK